MNNNKQSKSRKSSSAPRMLAEKRISLKPSHSPKTINVSLQAHYTNQPIQVMEYCQVNGLDWCDANVVKYVSRARWKNGLEDYKKAMDYLRCKINLLETGKFLPPSKLTKTKEK